MADRASVGVESEFDPKLRGGPESAYGKPKLLRRSFMLPALLYPLWHLAAPATATDPWIAWWLVGGSFLAVGLASSRIRIVQENLPTFFHLCSWLVTGQLYTLAFVNDMHAFYAIGSVMAVLATVMSIQSKSNMLAYGIFVALMSAVFYVLAPDPYKLAYWGGTLTVIAGTYYRLKLQIAAADFTRDVQETLSQRVDERTAELSEANRRLREEMERRAALEEELRLSQKLEAVGQLAGGVAHEFNNLLTRIRLYTELLLEGVGAESPVQGEIAEIQKASRQASDLTKQLLTFSHRGNVQTVVLDLNEVVMEASSMLRHVVGEDIELQFAWTEGPICIEADRGQIEQILVNLALNARDAMPDGGQFRIETSTLRRPATSKPDLGESLTSDEFVVLSVSDTGIGMDAATRERAFDPFFTRKAVDAGTGLGLSIVYGIVNQAGGFVRLLSEPGKGARFELNWPRSSEAPSNLAREPLPSSALGGSERILLVEDEDDLRCAVRTLLTGNGYDVLDADNGEEALRIADHYDGEIDLLLSDVVMPRMGGLELRDALVEMRPGTSVLLMSGHLNHPSLREQKLPTDIAFLPKPFDPEDLTSKIREVLDSRSGHELG